MPTVNWYHYPSLEDHKSLISLNSAKLRSQSLHVMMMQPSLLLRLIYAFDMFTSEVNKRHYQDKN